MAGGALQSTGNALDVAIQGPGMFRVAPSTAVPPAANPAASSTPAPATSPPTARATWSPRTATTSRAARPGRRRHAARQIPAERDQRRDRPERRRLLRRPDGHARRARATISLATFANSAGLERSGANRWLQSAELGRADRRHPGRAAGLHDRRRDRDVQRGPRPGVHEHDHRPARLPGQLARHLDRGRDAPGSGEPEALGARRRRGSRAPALMAGARVVNRLRAHRGRIHGRDPSPSPRARRRATFTSIRT